MRDFDPHQQVQIDLGRALDSAVATDPGPEASERSDDEGAGNTSGGNSGGSTNGSASLPLGWASALDEDGDTYYYNEETRESTYDPPHLALLHSSLRDHSDEVDGGGLSPPFHDDGVGGKDGARGGEDNGEDDSIRFSPPLDDGGRDDGKDMDEDSIRFSPPLDDEGEDNCGGGEEDLNLGDFDINLDELVGDVLSGVNDLDRTDSSGDCAALDEDLSLQHSVQLVKGMSAEARYGGGLNYFKGKVVRIRPPDPSKGVTDETYDILYEVGDKEFKVPRNLIRPILMQKDPPSHTLSWMRPSLAHTAAGGNPPDSSITSPYNAQRRRRSNAAYSNANARLALTPPGSPNNPHKFARGGRKHPATPALTTLNSMPSFSDVRHRSSSTGSMDSTTSVSTVGTVGTVNSIHDEDDLFPGQQCVDLDHIPKSQRHGLPRVSSQTSTISDVDFEGGGRARSQTRDDVDFDDVDLEDRDDDPPAYGSQGAAFFAADSRARRVSDPVDLETLQARARQEAREQTLAYQGGRFIVTLWHRLLGKEPEKPADGPPSLPPFLRSLVFLFPFFFPSLTSFPPSFRPSVPPSFLHQRSTGGV
jgi:hypothetical protein